MQFILESQARAEVRMDKAEARVDAMERRLDRRMDGITKLLEQGMRMLVKIETKLATVVEEMAEFQKRTEIRFAELAEAQKGTERTLKAFIASLRHGRNGR